MNPLKAFKKPAIRFITFFITIIFLWQIVLAKTSDSLLNPYTKVQLENGLTLVVKEVHSAPIAAVDIWVGTGSINETPTEAGISHFFEHMLFKGTTKRKVGEIAREIKAVGGYQNAATSLDTTHYYVVVPSEKVDLALDVEADAIMNSTFEPAEIERERKVILEERRLKENSPNGKLGLLVYQTVFKGTPYANDILGTADSLGNINQGTFLDYYHRYYRPNNMVVAVVGDVNTEKIISQVQGLFRDFKAGDIPESAKFSIPVLKNITRVEAEMPVDQTYLYFAFPGPGINHPDEAALTMLSIILGDGQGSLLYQNMLEQKQMVNEIAAGYQTYHQIGLFAIYAQTSNTTISTIETEIQKNIRRIINKGVSEADLKRAKALMESNIAYAMETNADIASIIGDYQLNGDLNDLDRFMKEFRKVSIKDLRRVAKKYLNPKAYVLAIVKPQEVAK